MTKKYQNITVNKLPKREVEIVGEISAETMTEMRGQAIDRIKEDVEIDGFRKGNAPENMIVQRVGEMKILEETAEMALGTVYPDILEDEKIDAIGRPEVTITKMAPGEALGFKIKTALTPEIKLGDYKKIAADVQPVEVLEVTDKEVDDVIMDVRRNVAHSQLHDQAGLSETDHNHGEIKDEDLPEINDDFLKMIGGFASVEDLKEKVRANLAREKEVKAKDKKRTTILENIVNGSTIELAQVIIDAELEKMLAQFKDDISRMNISFEEYLKNIKKTEADVRTEWQETAEKRAKGQVVLNTIAREEGIRPEEEEIKKEMDNILQHDAKLERFRVRMFVENFLANEMVFKFLDKESGSK